jgi:ribosomal protein L16 Arg81 hydroxylase
MTLSFEWLLEPITPQAFFAQYYERQPLLVARGEPRRFEALLTLGAIDRFLATTSPRHPDVFLVDAARKLSAEDYTLAEPDGNGELDLPRLYELFRTGATISLRRLNESLPELGALCRAVEQVFSGHFQTNIYLSPPAAQGFATHFDSHDVFVLQVSGSKVWTLYDTLIELPLHGQAFDKTKHQPGPPSREITIRAGDLFYCPRGLFHSARSTEETSLHITLGLIGKTWADVMLEAVSAACLAAPAFRRNLPAGFANPDFDPGSARATFRALVDSFAQSAALEPILQKLAEDFVTSRRPDLAGTLQEIDHKAPLVGDTRLVARPHLAYRLNEDGNEVALLFGASRLTLPAAAAEPLRFALAGAPFRVKDLPGRLDDAGKIVLARRLLREGLLLRTA